MTAAFTLPARSAATVAGATASADAGSATAAAADAAQKGDIYLRICSAGVVLDVFRVGAIVLSTTDDVGLCDL